MPTIYQIENDPQSREFATYEEAEAVARQENILGDNGRPVIEEVASETELVPFLEEIAVSPPAYLLPEEVIGFLNPITGEDEEVTLIVKAPSGTQCTDGLGNVLFVIP